MKKDLDIESGIYTVHSTNRIFVKKPGHLYLSHSSKKWTIILYLSKKTSQRTY